MEPNTPAAGTFKMEGSLRRFLIAYAGAFVIGVVLTYMFAIVLMRAGHLVYLLAVIPLFVYVFGDLFVWLRRGVRSVEIDSTGLILHLARELQPTLIETNQVTGVYVSRFLDRTTVNIVLRGATVRQFLGMRRYSGPRFRLTNEPFDSVQFQDFIHHITKFRHTSQKQ